MAISNPVTVRAGITSGTSFAGTATLVTEQLEIVRFASTASNTVTPPSGVGWATIFTKAGSGNPTFQAWARTIPASPTNGSFTIGSATSGIWSQTIIASGFDPVTPVQTGTTASSSTAGTSIVAPSVTSVAPGSLLLNEYEEGLTNGSVTLPGGQSADAASLGTTAAISAGWGYETLAAAGASGTRTATASGTTPSSGGISIVVNPLVSAVTPLRLVRAAIMRAATR